MKKTDDFRPPALILEDQASIWGSELALAVPQYAWQYIDGWPGARRQDAESKYGFVSADQCANRILKLDPRPEMVLVSDCFRVSNNSDLVKQQLHLVELLRSEHDFPVPIIVLTWMRPDALRSLLDRTRASPPHFTGLLRFIRQLPLDEADSSVHTALLDQSDPMDAVANNIAQMMQRFDSDGGVDRLTLTCEILESELERKSHYFRHQHHSILASLRLLLGAYSTGNIDGQVFNESLTELGCADQGKAQELHTLYLKWMYAHDQLIRHRGQEHTRPSKSRNQPYKGRVLVVDDQLAGPPPDKETRGDAGWKVVYESILGRSEVFRFDVVGCDTFEDSFRLINDASIHSLDLVILDIDLGDPDRSGLHLLQEIRSRDPFLAVVVTTSFDDAEVCQMSMELQADAFFSKQLTDPNDRDSRKYFQKFQATLCQVLNESRPNRLLYQQFVELIPYIDRQDSAACYISRREDGVLGELTKFFMLLRIADQHHLFRSLLTDSRLKDPQDSFDELVVTLLDAAIASLNWGRGRTEGKIAQLGQWLQENSNTQDPRRQVISTLSQWSKIRHGHLQPISLNKARELAASFLRHLARDAGPPSVVDTDSESGNSCVADSDVIRRLIERSRIRQRKNRIAHSAQSRMGSEAVLLGTYLHSSKQEEGVEEILEEYLGFGPDEEPADVIYHLETQCESRSMHIPVLEPVADTLRISLIDDRGRENGWAYAAQVVINNAVFENVELDGAERAEEFTRYVMQLSQERIRGSHLLILDLTMPESEGAPIEVVTGLRVAETLRRWDPLIPIVLLSAHQSTLSMRKALKYGVNDFFPKECPGHGDRADLERYASHFSLLPERLGLFPPRWLEFLTRCRYALGGLDTLLEQAASNDESLDEIPLLSRELLIDNRAGPIGWSRANNAVELGPIREHVVSFIRWFFRRSLFFLMMPRERFLCRWFDYFTRAVPRIRSDFLGYEQIWLNTAMIVEFVFGVITGMTHVSPGQRSSRGNQQISDVIGTANLELGLAIWNDRNQRRYADVRNPLQESVWAQQTVSDCMRFLIGLGLLPEDVGAVHEHKLRDDLRSNLRDSLDRSECEVNLESLKRQMAQLGASGKWKERHQSILADLEARCLEYETRSDHLTLASVLDTRHRIGRCLDLLP